ncbi:hypothetical protein EZV62_001438 [Acer yangbiense]|uniref:SANTA domain-containing protein n=1 Tax=Acer yangbiense TaxID=1000413 RepID=A0A5C7IUV1_9ROSI|nr:hypothetical protein EZV62_001438 [Acer yangbiense]
MNTICPLCLKKAKTTLHVLWRCSLLRDIRAASMLSGGGSFLDSTPFSDFILACWDRMNVEEFELLCVVWWRIWFSRNQVVHFKVGVDVREVNVLLVNFVPLVTNVVAHGLAKLALSYVGVVSIAQELHANSRRRSILKPRRSISLTPKTNAKQSSQSQSPKTLFTKLSSLPVKFVLLYVVAGSSRYQGLSLFVGLLLEGVYVLMSQGVRTLHSATIVKRHDTTTLKTTDGITVTISGLINSCSSTFPPFSLDEIPVTRVRDFIMSPQRDVENGRLAQKLFVDVVEKCGFSVVQDESACKRKKNGGQFKMDTKVFTPSKHRHKKHV